jgi:hypothetical protein
MHQESQRGGVTVFEKATTPYWRYFESAFFLFLSLFRDHLWVESSPFGLD